MENPVDVVAIAEEYWIHHLPGHHINSFLKRDLV